MILWIKNTAVEMPCDQRAKLISVNEKNRTVLVELCGTNVEYNVAFANVVGVELKRTSRASVALLFKVTGNMGSL